MDGEKWAAADDVYDAFFRAAGAPIRPMRSPSETMNKIFLKSGAIPNFFERSCALIIGIELLNLLLLPLQVYTRTVSEWLGARKNWRLERAAVVCFLSDGPHSNNGMFENWRLASESWTCTGLRSYGSLLLPLYVMFILRFSN